MLARATWNLGVRDLEAVTSAVRRASRSGGADGPVELRTQVLSAVAELRRLRRLPRYVTLVAADNELPVDLDNPLSVVALAHEVAGQRGVQLTELFPNPNQLIARADDGRYTNEVVLMFTRKGGSVRGEAPLVDRAPAIRRTFPPGSEWLYAKVYCGVSTADRVLREAIGPVAREAQASGDADRWFFVRYADPRHHLRVRFAGEPARLLGAVMPALERAIAPMLASGAVHRVQLDTYVRELERYGCGGGEGGMELVERLFWMDSEAVMDIVDRLDGDSGGDARWRLALRGIDGLLEALGLDWEERRLVILRARDSLGAEHQVTPDLWSALGARYTRLRAELEIVFARDPARDVGHPLAFGFETLARRDARIAEAVRASSEHDHEAHVSRRPEMAWSLAHMHVNRLLHASQRTQEMVLYDFLRRLHATRQIRKDPIATAAIGHQT